MFAMFAIRSHHAAARPAVRPRHRVGLHAVHAARPVAAHALRLRLGGSPSGLPGGPVRYRPRSGAQITPEKKLIGDKTMRPSKSPNCCPVTTRGACYNPHGGGHRPFDGSPGVCRSGAHVPRLRTLGWARHIGSIRISLTGRRLRQRRCPVALLPHGTRRNRLAVAVRTAESAP